MKAWLVTDMEDPKSVEIWTKKPTDYDDGVGYEPDWNDEYMVVSRRTLNKSVEKPKHGTDQIVPVNLTITKR